MMTQDAERAWRSPADQPGGRQAGGSPAPDRQPATAPPPPRVAGWLTAPLQPGVLPLRPLTAGEIIDAGFAVLRRHPRLMLGMGAATAVVDTVVALALRGGDSGGGEATGGQVGALSFSAGDVASPHAWLPLMVGAFLAMVLTGFVAVVVGEAVLGRRPSGALVWARVRPRLPVLLVVAALAGVAPYVALVALVVPGLVLWAGWALAVPAAMLEGTGVRHALGRSWRLARRDLARVWGIRALAAVVVAVIEGLVAVPLTVPWLASGAGADDPSTAQLATTALASVLAETLLLPVSAAIVTVLYLDRRMRAEALDVTLQRSLVSP